MATLTPYLPALLAPVVAWRIYVRYRRLVGVQNVRPVRLWLSATLFPLLFVLLALASWREPLAFGALLAGGAAGAALSFYGLRRTVFHSEDGALRYTPDARIGMVLIVLVVARLAWRLVALATAGLAASEGGAVHLNPLTLLVLGLMMAYYPMYSAGVLRWARRHWQRKP